MYILLFCFGLGRIRSWSRQLPRDRAVNTIGSQSSRSVEFNFTFRYIQVLVHVLLGILRERERSEAACIDHPREERERWSWSRWPPLRTLIEAVHGQRQLWKRWRSEVQWGRRGDAVVAEVLPVTWLCTICRSKLGFVSGECGSGEPRALSHRPPPLFIAQGDGGPLAIDGLGAPDQGASQGPRRLLGLLWLGDHSNILPLIPTFTLIFKLWL
jgi:hypothetical protein